MSNRDRVPRAAPDRFERSPSGPIDTHVTIVGNNSQGSTAGSDIAGKVSF